MIKKWLPVLMIIASLFAEDRGYVYNSGGPYSTEGHVIFNHDGESFSLSQRFNVSRDYVVELIGLYLTYAFYPIEFAISFHQGDQYSPGEVFYEHQYSIAREEMTDRNLYTLPVDDCILIEPGVYYWISVTALPGSEFIWQYSIATNFPFATSDDLGQEWSDIQYGVPGAALIWGTETFDNSFSGDVNVDYRLDVIDIVMLVGFIVGQIELTPTQQELGDINGDGTHDVIDVVQLVDLILYGFSAPMPEFMLEDLNPNSPTFGQLVGTETYLGQISCYYFGKAG